MRIALVKDNVVDNIVIAEEDFALDGFLSISVEDMHVDLGDTLYYEENNLVHVKKAKVEELSEIELLKKQLEEQQALINAILGVDE